MKPTIQSVKGTRDFYPEDMSARTWLYQELRKVSESFGFQEYDGPFLEKIDLYAAKSGEELVKEQSFVFPDRGGDLITLRPELTPSLARMVAQRQNELAFPLRWWSFGPFWRYERPQKGRSREFFQWNADIIGVNTPETDAELIAICISFFKQVGLSSKQVQVLVNHRQLMDSCLAEMGVAVDLRKSVFKLIDRVDKMKAEDWDIYALEIGLTRAQLEGVKALLADPQLWKKSPELVRIYAVLEGMGLGEYIRYDARIIRGLDYYTGVVFEAVAVEEGGRAILGGGHYDNLVGDVGGDPLPGVGFAMGDVMATIILRKYGLIPTTSAQNTPILVTVFDEAHLVSSFALASELRSAGLKVINFTEPVKLPRQLKFADRMNIRIAVIAGPDELAEQKVAIKDLAARTQVVVDRNLAAETIREMLASMQGA